MAFLTLMKMTVVGYPPNISWLDNAIRMLLTATDHPIYGIKEISKNQLWKLKIMLPAFPNPKKQNHLLFQQSIFFLAFLGLWKILRKGFIGVLSDIVPIGGGLLFFFGIFLW